MPSGFGVTVFYFPIPWSSSTSHCFLLSGFAPSACSFWISASFWFAEEGQRTLLNDGLFSHLISLDGREISKNLHLLSNPSHIPVWLTLFQDSTQVHLSCSHALMLLPKDIFILCLSLCFFDQERWKDFPHFPRHPSPLISNISHFKKKKKKKEYCRGARRVVVFNILLYKFSS